MKKYIILIVSMFLFSNCTDAFSKNTGGQNHVDSLMTNIVSDSNNNLFVVRNYQSYSNYALMKFDREQKQWLNIATNIKDRPNANTGLNESCNRYLMLGENHIKDDNNLYLYSKDCLNVVDRADTSKQNITIFKEQEYLINPAYSMNYNMTDMSFVKVEEHNLSTGQYNIMYEFPSTETLIAELGITEQVNDYNITCVPNLKENGIWDKKSHFCNLYINSDPEITQLYAKSYYFEIVKNNVQWDISLLDTISDEGNYINYIYVGCSGCFDKFYHDYEDMMVQHPEYKSLISTSENSYYYINNGNLYKFFIPSEAYTDDISFEYYTQDDPTKPVATQTIYFDK